MKHIIAIVLIFSLHPAYSQVFKNEDLSITKLEDHMWVVETTDNTTMYIIEGKDKAVLIDTGTKCEKLDEVVKNITKKPLYVILTHIHVDHAGNIFDFDEIYFHKDDSVLMKHLPSTYEGKIHYINNEDVFDLGDKKLEVKLMPGHTPGSIILLDYESGNSYTGDAFGSGQVWCQLKPFSTMETYANSCNQMLKIMNKGITKIYCGHYPYVKKAYDITYIQDMYTLANMLIVGTQPEPEPHSFKIPEMGVTNPMMTTYKSASIVYDPEHLK